MQENGLESNRLIQMCIITKDGDRVNRNWAELLGFDYAGLAVYDDPGNNVPTWYHGQWYRTSGIASNAVDLVSDGKWMQFEVLQAKNGPSEWNDFMQVRNGMHHVAFEVGDGMKALAQIEKHSGRKPVQYGATFMDPDCWYGYLDTKNGMGTTIELLGFGDRLDDVHVYRNRMIQMDLQSTDPERPLAGQIPCALTLIAENADEMAARYKVFLDAEPVSCGSVEDQIDGKGVQSYRKAVFDVETTKLEILEPGSTDTVWAEFGKQWKDGLFGMCFESADLEEDVRKLAGFHLKPVQAGEVNGVRYVLLDGTEDYSCMIELRTSEEIAAHVNKAAQERSEKRKRYGADLKINQSTGIGNIMDDERLYGILSEQVPAVRKLLDSQAGNKTIRRMPLGFVLRAVPTVKEEDIQNVIQKLNEE